ncbi:hypothetical protein HY469_02215 [Candidatus Roizmanbacteria bacterium]|nr:hypothetical protein [Candidatus Roizmanbacteria bacterium]
MTGLKTLKAIYQDIDRETVEDGEIFLDKITAATQKRIIEQVNEEYVLSFDFNEAKRATMLARLKLYNNQRRDQNAVGDPLMFTVFNTVHAALYDDRLMATWEGRSGKGDEDIEENLNALSEFDYDIMGKSELDYYWNWDAEFFGRGLLQMMDFNRESGVMAPAPELIDAVAFIRDPNAKSVNGDIMGRGAMRFGGVEVGATYYELKNLPGYFNLASLKKDKEVKSLLKEAREARSQAQGTTKFNAQEEALGKFNNYEFNLLNWFTTIRGERYLVTLGNRRTSLVRLVKLPYGRRWPIIDRALYPMAHDWDGVSIPDLTEDKQRARAILINLGLKSAKSDAMPQYLFDQDRIKNKNDLNWRSDKFIGVNGRVDNAIMPLQKSTVHQYVNIIMDILDTAAQRATATPEIQQGVPSSVDRTLGELNLVSSKVDTRYSMNAKVYGWSEKAFWLQWYRQYKIYFKDKIDEKIVRIQGALAPTWRPLMKDNIVSDVDPDVKIESRVISEAKKQRTLQSFSGFAGFASMAIQNPDNNRRAIEKKYAKLQGMSKEEIDMMFPPTVDEMQAEAENEILNTGKIAKVNINDDHLVHIQIHAKANQNPQSAVHIRAHKKLMLIKRDRPDLFPQMEAQPFQPPAGEKRLTPALPTPTTPTT